MQNPFLKHLRQEFDFKNPKALRDQFRSKPKRILPKVPVADQRPNLVNFFVLYDKYYSHHEDLLAPADSWWEEATMRPTDLADCVGMSFDESLIWRNLNAGRHVCLSGKAGSGKSTLIRSFINSCSKANFPYAVCAPTAIAAYNIEGETLHKRLGLRLAEEPAPELWKMINKAKKRYSKTWAFLEKTQLFLIDEISMTGPDFFEKLDYLFQKARNSTEPFGGCKVIMIGDFTQLGPVIDWKKKNEEVTLSNINKKSTLVLETDTWSRMKIARVILLRSYRQKDGDRFLKLLDNIRVGRMTRDDQKLILSRIDKKLDIETQVPEGDGKKSYKLEPIDIFPHRKSVDQRNQKKLDELIDAGAQKWHFRPFFKVQKKDANNVLVIDSKDKKAGEELAKNRERLAAIFNTVFDVTLCKGCQVMMRSNSYMELGIFNGSMGIVTEVTKHEVMVIFVVKGKFMEKPIKVDRAMFSRPIGNTGEIVMSQFPLTLAYSCTIHKCQGLTMDSIRLDARHCWEPGQLYTALSRVRCIEDLYLFGFNSRSLLVNAGAVEFEAIQLPDVFRKLEGLPLLEDEKTQHLTEEKDEVIVTGKRTRNEHEVERDMDMNYTPKRARPMEMTIEKSSGDAAPLLTLADLMKSGGEMIMPY